MEEIRSIDLLGRGTKITLLDGKEYTILYDLEAMIMLEDAMEEDDVLSRKLRSLLENRSPSWQAVRYLLWLGLRHFHPEITLEDLGKLVDIRDMSYVVGKISEALGLAMGQAEDDGGNLGSQDGSPGQSSISLPGKLA